MATINVSISANADDGHARKDSALSWSNSFTYETLGNTGSVAFHNFFRFQNVAIPAGSTIVSAILRWHVWLGGSVTTCNLQLSFEDAANPTRPTSATDLSGRPRTSEHSWNAVPTFTHLAYQYSPDLATELQEVIDLGGWASGNAVTCHIRDNSSTGGAWRGVASADHADNDPPELIVEYTLPPYQIILSDSIEISESVAIESDLITQENIELTESVEALLGFDESLPLISENITISESLTIIRGLGGVPVQSEDIGITESVGLLIGFGESLPEFSESINITEFAYVDVGPQISVFESITVNDYGNIQPEITVFDSLSLAESVTVRRGYQVAVDESFSFSDTFTLFNYTDWFRTNKARSKERFFFTLTGITDQTTDIEIPVSSIYATKRSGDPTYLQVVVPTLNYSADIAIRSNAQMIVEIGYETDGVISLREQILVSDLDDIRVDEGPVNRSVTLSGHRTISYGGNLVTFSRSDVTYRAVQTRARVFRFAFIDPFLNPGDTVVIDYESFTCNNIVYIINPKSSIMEVREAL